MAVEIIGVPMDLGTNRRGTDMGPSAIRYAGLRKALMKLGKEIIDHGNLAVPVSDSIQIIDHNHMFLDDIIKVCSNLSDKVKDVLIKNNFPIVLGGDHSIAMGTMSGVGRAIPDVGLIWFDAHGDFNTSETSMTGNIHGMPLAAATGRGHPKLINIGGITPYVNEEKTVVIGIRDLDIKEKLLLKKSKVTVYSMKKIDEMGLAEVVKEALTIAGKGSKAIHVSFDLDVVDPTVASGVGTPVPGGLTYREAHLALELISESRMLRSLEMCEVNPIFDNGGNRTAALAVELITSALGKIIYD